MVCFSTNGYHSQSKYQWYYSEDILTNEIYPVFYGSRLGTYKCEIDISGEVKYYLFTVQGV